MVNSASDLLQRRPHAPPPTAHVQRFWSQPVLHYDDTESTNPYLFEQEFLYAGTHYEIEKLFRDRKGCLPTGPYHRVPELHRRMPSGQGLINDAHLPAVDRIHAVDEAHVRVPRVNLIHNVVPGEGGNG